MMTLDEAIKHAEEVAEQNETQAEKWQKEGGEKWGKTTVCRECAAEHRQLAEWLKELKQLREQTRWIPCSERLPEERETVLVCYRSQGGVAQSVCEWFDMPNRGIVWSTLCGQKPIAWQPLPPSYKGE